MSISAAAYEALQRLDDGHRLNTTHRLARELIAANLAHAGFGILEITEAGRIWLRRGVVRKEYLADDPNVANLSAQPAQPAQHGHSANITGRPGEPTSGELVRGTDSLPVPPEWHPPLVLPPEAPPAPEVMPPAPLTDAALAWSRPRAIAAAGVANGKTNIWVATDWLDAFMQAYEA